MQALAASRTPFACSGHPNTVEAIGSVRPLSADQANLAVPSLTVGIDLMLRCRARQRRYSRGRRRFGLRGYVIVIQRGESLVNGAAVLSQFIPCSTECADGS
jgi:hypothetical protein